MFVYDYHYCNDDDDFVCWYYYNLIITTIIIIISIILYLLLWLWNSCIPLFFSLIITIVYYVAILVYIIMCDDFFRFLFIFDLTLLLLSCLVLSCHFALNSVWDHIMSCHVMSHIIIRMVTRLSIQLLCMVKLNL